MKVVTCEGQVIPHEEDGGQALIAQIDSADECFFCRLQSWDPERRHAVMNRLRGKRVRVIVETIDV